MSLSAVYPHRIRLRGPWECERLLTAVAELARVPPGSSGTLASSATTMPSEPQARRVTMPCRWLEAGLGDFRGIARFTRNFGYPGNVDHTEHVWLTCDGCTGCREVRLNGQLLSGDAGPTFTIDVTNLLADRNRLVVLIDGQADGAGLWGEVAMEIRKDAFLDDVAVERSGTGVTLAGKVVGIAPQALELYVLIDGRHVHYQTIMPSESGTLFHFPLPEAAPSSQSVRVELICISSIWYTVELPIPPWKPA